MPTSPPERPAPPQIVPATRWHRALIPEDVETARGIEPMHRPTGPDPDRPVCASATHLVFPARWPCPQHRWATWVLETNAREPIR